MKTAWNVTSNMKVVYDISVLGCGHYQPTARTGVFRVVENIARGLAASKECDLTFCSSLSLEALNQTIDYLKSTDWGEDIPFLSTGRSKDLHKELSKIVTIINKEEPVSLLMKISRRVLLYGIRLIEANFSPLSRKALLGKDIFHSPYFALPEESKNVNRLKRVLTVYDLIPILYSQFFELNSKGFYEILNSLTPRDWVICISQATKNDLCNYRTDLDAGRVFLTQLAASELFYRCEDFSEIASVRKKYQIPDSPYILSLSTLEPRKNIAHTIRCFAKTVQQENLKDLHLVLVGTKGWDYNEIFEEISKYEDIKKRIIITGYVADEDLAALYSGALAFVYPSFYEGFGLPPLEAMQCGVPVITSNTSSLPEVVGDAGITVAPTDADALCHSMLEIYNKPSLREAMSLKSIDRAKQFSWEKCTQETFAAYKTALSE